MHIPCPHVSLPSPIQNLLIFLEPFFMCLLQNDNFSNSSTFSTFISQYSCIHVLMNFSFIQQVIIHHCCFGTSIPFWLIETLSACFPGCFVSWSHHSLSTSLFFGIASYTMLFYSPSPGIHHFSLGNAIKNSDLVYQVYLL